MKYFNFLPLILLICCCNFSFSQDKNLSEIFLKYYKWYPCEDAQGKWTFRSVDGQQLNHVSFDTVTEFIDHGVAGVCLNGRYGAIDRVGKYIVPLIYDKVEINRDAQIILVSSIGEDHKKKMGVYNLSGELIVPVKYASCSPSGESASDYRHIQGKETILCRYESGLNRGSTRVVVSLTGKVLIDTTTFNKPSGEEWFYFVNDEQMVGSVHLPYDRSVIRSASNSYKNKLSQYFVDEYEPGMAAENIRYIIPTDAGEMLLNVQGDTIVEPKKDQQFLLGTVYGKSKEDAFQLISFSEKKKWGLMDKNGRILVEPRFDAPIEYNQNGGASHISGKTMLFDTLWQEINFGKHQHVTRLESYYSKNKWPKTDWRQDHFLSEKNGKYGVITRDGKTIVPITWGEIILMYCDQNRALLIMKQKTGKTAVAIYDANEKVLAEKCLDAHWLSAHVCLIQQEKTSDIFNMATGEFIRKGIVNVAPQDTEKGDFSYSPIQADFDLKPNNLICIYIQDKGWELIDSVGNTIVSARHPECEHIKPIIRADTVWGVVYSDYTDVLLRTCVETKEKTIIPFTDGVLEYQPHENRIRRYVEHRSSNENDSNRDSIDIYSMDGTKLKTVQKNHFAFIPATGNFKEPFYIYREAAGFNFYDLNFKPMFPEYFESISGDQHTKYFTGKIKGKNFVIFSENGLVRSRPYDEIIFSKPGFIGKYGEQEDLYNRDGKLMFAGCENLRQFTTYFTFQKNGKTCNANLAGEIYMTR